MVNILMVNGVMLNRVPKHLIIRATNYTDFTNYTNLYKYFN